MEYEPGSSTGSTVSGDINTVFKTKNPIGYIYLAHPFGTLGSPQNQYINNNNIKLLQFQSSLSPIKRQETKMNFRCQEYYQEKSYQDRNPLQNQINENTGNKIVFEDYLLPEFKYIIDTIRKAWNSTSVPLRYQTLKCKNDPRKYLRNYSQENERIQSDRILQKPKHLIRRYSLPETAIRKYNFIYEYSSGSTSDQHKFPIKKKFPETNNNKYKQYTNKKSNSKYQMTNNNNIVASMSYMDLLDNFEKPIIDDDNKPLTMPAEEVVQKKDCFYCSSKKNKSIEKFDKEEDTKKSTNSSDIFISDLLIGNLNEDLSIAEMLMNDFDIDYHRNKIQKTSQDIKEKKKHQISSIYISPDRLIGLVNSNKNMMKTYQTYKDINIKSSESLLEIPKLIKETNENLIKNITEDVNFKNNLNKISTNNDNQSPILLKRPESTIISSSFSLTNTSDNDGVSISEMQLLPIGNNKLYDDNQTNNLSHPIKFPILKNDNVLLSKREKIMDNGLQRNRNNFKIPVIEELIKTPFKNQISGRKQSTISKSILNSLEAYTFDSVGNLNFRVLSSSISKRERHSIDNSSYRQCLYNPNENNVRKITIFEAQSNIVTPDNDNGPRRFYQKTEILNGDKKIDILEIVECMQNCIDYKDYKPKSVFHTKVSKIPIPIDKCKFIKKQKIRSAKNSLVQQPAKLSKINILNEKHKDDKKYEENIEQKMYPSYEKNNIPKCIYPLEKITKHSSKVNSKIQAVKPLRPFTNNIKNEMNIHKNYNLSRENQKDQYSSTGAYLSTITDNSLQNTITPSTGTAIHGSTSHNQKFSDQFSNNTDSPLFRVNNNNNNNVPSLMKTNKLNTITNLNSQNNNLENNKIDIQQVCQYDLKNSNDYIRHNKLNAWRIPSSDFYEKNKRNIGMHIDSMPRIIPKTTNTDSSIKCKTICNNNCQPCCSTFNSRIVYSPTLSICSLCSKVYNNSTRLPTCNTECTQSEHKISIDPNCKDCNKNCKNFPTISNSLSCDCMVENSNISYLCNQQDGISCQYSKCSKIDDLIFPEGILSNSRLDFSADGLVTSSTITEPPWTSHNEVLSCNWKPNNNNNQSKRFNLTSETKQSIQKNPNSSKPVWTVTVTTKCLQQASDLKMEFKFPQPPAELSIQNNFSENEENDDDISIDSVNSAQRTSNPTISDEIYYAENNHNKTASNRHIENSYEDDFGGYSLNLANLLSKRNGLKSKQDSKNLSVMGNAIAPEQKPRVQTMSERDLTRRRCHKNFNNFSMKNNL